MSEKEIVKLVVEELDRIGLIKRNNNTFKNTESLLYSYNVIKETIGQRKKQIKELKKYGIPEKSKSIVVMNATKGKLDENDLLDATIINIEKSIYKTKVILNYLDKILLKFKSDSYFSIIELKYFQNKTTEEIAEIMEKDISTITRNKNRLINALKMYLMPNDILSDILGY